MKVRSRSSRDPLRRAPSLPALPPFVEIPVSLNLRGPDDMQRRRVVISRGAAEDIASFRQLKSVGRRPCRTVELADHDAVVIFEVLLPRDRYLARRPGCQCGKIRLALLHREALG